MRPLLLTSYFNIAVLLCQALFLNSALFIPESGAETAPQHFQFDRFNKDYENIAPAIKAVKSGPLIIRLSSPVHRLTLYSHLLEVSPGKDDTYQARLSVEIEGKGQLLAEIDLLGMRRQIQDRFQIPRQKKQVTGEIRVDREAEGYRITPIKIPKAVSITIYSDLGKQLVAWCKVLSLALMNCDDLDRMLSELTLSLPQDKPFFVKDAELAPKEQEVLDRYFIKE